MLKKIRCKSQYVLTWEVRRKKRRESTYCRCVINLFFAMHADKSSTWRRTVMIPTLSVNFWSTELDAANFRMRWRSVEWISHSRKVSTRTVFFFNAPQMLDTSAGVKSSLTFRTTSSAILTHSETLLRK